MTDRPLAVILTGGRATRLRPLSHELPKALVPVMNRPLISYALERLGETGIEDDFPEATDWLDQVEGALAAFAADLRRVAIGPDDSTP